MLPQVEVLKLALTWIKLARLGETGLKLLSPRSSRVKRMTKTKATRQGRSGSGSDPIRIQFCRTSLVSEC